MASVLVDTNLLYYAHDASDPAKQDRAIQTLDDLYHAGAGRLSVQCLAEFYVSTTRGSEPMLSHQEAAQQVDRLYRSWAILPLTSLIVLEAVRGAGDHQLNYWDAQVWATGRLNQVPIVFTEDFQADRVLEGVRFVNPFAEEFEIGRWL